jgi:hypothetical protein
MRETWKQILNTCRSLSQETGVKLPAVFNNQPQPGEPMSRNFADPGLYNQMMLDNLASFLDEVDQSFQKPPKAAKKTNEQS